MGKAQKRKLERRLERQAAATHQVFLTNIEGAEHGPPDRATWPIVRAFVPQRDCWRATGYGTAGVIRQGPDGKCSYAFFPISLHEQGLKSMFGKDDETLSRAEGLPQEMHEVIPPTEEGPAELAADYIYGAWALSQQTGAWPPGQERRFLGLVPRPPGDESQWVERLIGPGGLTPPDLLKVLRDNPRPPDLADGQDIMIMTTMTFALADHAAALRRLHAAGPAFHLSGRDGKEEVFDWTRAYPKGHWSPLSKLGGRQVLGSVRVRPGVLIGEAKVLSMAAKLVDELRTALGPDQLSLERTEWMSPLQMMAAKGR